MNRLLLFLACVSLFACDANETEQVSDDFDRELILVNWADNIIIPAYQSFEEKVELMDAAVIAFTETPNLSNLTALREQWQSTYLSWQSVAMFQIGEAETSDMQGNMNSFPTDNEVMEELIAAETYNLLLPSRREVQGFPAIDYLINGLAASDELIIDTYEGADNYSNYLLAVSARIKELTHTVLSDWQNGYRDEFVANSGSSATSAVNKLTNDFIFYYEAMVRSKKVSTPSGVFSGTINITYIEAYYKNDISKLLFEESLTATQNFFAGKHFNSSTTGESLESYLDYIDGLSGKEELLSDVIHDQYVSISEASNMLDDSFSAQIDADINSMYELHEVLNKNVQYFKTDMISALNIRVDYVDSDGD